MIQFSQLELQYTRTAQGRAVLVRVALGLLMVSMLGGSPSVWSALRASCEEGTEEVRLQEELVAIAHRRIRQKSFESQHYQQNTSQHSHISSIVSGVSPTHVLDGLPPAWFLLGAGIRIIC